VDPFDGTVANSAPILFFTPGSDYVLSARVTVKFATKWDAGALMLMGDDHHWATSELHRGFPELAPRPRDVLGPHHGGGQKLCKRKSLALPSTFSRIAGSGSMRAISVAPIIVEKIAKKARSLSTVRRPGMKGSIWLL
jgi:hypothetical protein